MDLRRALVEAKIAIDRVGPEYIEDKDTRVQVTRLHRAVEALFDVFDAMKEASEQVVVYPIDGTPPAEIESLLRKAARPTSPAPPVPPTKTTPGHVGQYL